MEEEYYKTKESVDEYIKLAEGVNGMELIEKLKPLLELSSVLLEIGSGPGSDWEILNKLYTVVGSDFSNEFLSHLRSKYPDEKFLKLDAVTLKTELKFDGIYSNKVMHHLTDNDLAISIKRQHEILNTNGIICHSFWKGEGSEIFKGLFVNYHEPENLKEYYKEYFELLTIELYNEFEDGDSILLIGRKK